MRSVRGCTTALGITFLWIGRICFRPEGRGSTCADMAGFGRELGFRSAREGCTTLEALGGDVFCACSKGGLRSFPETGVGCSLAFFCAATACPAMAHIQARAQKPMSMIRYSCRFFIYVHQLA